MILKDIISNGNNMESIDKYQYWLKNTKDKTLLEELKSMNEKEIEDSFYKDLEFGTGGLRGIIGIGSNKMNVHTVAKASQGLANYINKKYKNPSVVIGRDTRINSDLFSNVASYVFSKNGILVRKYKSPLPVPTVSYGVRHFKASAGVMITASHNPSKYNGYKVYGDDGCQITSKAANEIYDEIKQIDEFQVDFNETSENIEYISDEVFESYLYEVSNQSVLFDEEINKDVSIVYTPLNGTGLFPVTRILKENGYTNIKIVKEQEFPDGNFPTCPYPNPEIKEALSLGIEYSKKENADLLIATDPDCDRVGIAIKDNEEYILLTGNEVGILLLDYICSQRLKHNKMPAGSIFIKTIVTSEMARRIADKYNVKTIDVLTGFKYIGEQIGLLENKESYILGFEESYGYLSGTYVRDKDGVNGVFLITEMFAYYKNQNISLIDKLNSLYKEFGYYQNSLLSYTFEGASGFSKIQMIMESLRNIHANDIGGYKVSNVIDYMKEIDYLPKANVLKFELEGNNTIVIRPSGTEPKIKIYISTCGNTIEESKRINVSLEKDISKYFI